ncbi:hypothetical protein HGP05_08380 [Streptococcus sanguinis]|uniref:Uncharacterized protein n=1 Tax=Streptococcus sanguinis TaxID=1305 RepID=A0A7Y0YS07_STRSA|nr:hypothetical protein [Streptococcus sanguinis]
MDAVLTAATGGFATYASVLAKTGKAATTTVQTVGKVVNYADDANDIAHTVSAMQDDPLGRSTPVWNRACDWSWSYSWK